MREKVVITDDHGPWEPKGGEVDYYETLNDKYLLEVHRGYYCLFDNFEFPPNKHKKHAYHLHCCEDEIKRRGLKV